MGEYKLKICPHCGKELEPKVEEINFEVQIIQCSPKASQYVKEVEDINAGCVEDSTKYPFNSLAVGYSVLLSIKQARLVVFACMYPEQKSEKQFKVIAHKEHGVCEVVRVK